MAFLIESLSDLHQASMRLSRLLNSDPQRAVDEARQLRGKGAMRDSARALRGGILIDGGGHIQDRHAVLEGVQIFRRLVSDNGKEHTLRYNLANGLCQLGRLNETKGPDHYVATFSERREARRIFQSVANEAEDWPRTAQALINLGNELDYGYRWVEAYDRWTRALESDPANTVAALSSARMLLRRMQHDLHHPPSLHQVTGYYARLASRKASVIQQIAGRHAMDLAMKLPTFRSSWRPRRLHQIKDESGRFVAEHRLALVGTVEGLDLRKKRWDDVQIPAISEKLSAGPGVPPLFAMFNQLKADFCAARWLAFSSEMHPPRDTSSYGDTLDYATYGIAPSLLVLAQRAALDILDRVAVCANEYFNFGSKPNEIHFRTFWREKDGTGDWRPRLKEELEYWNPGIIALGELASDLCEGGLLALHRDLRNVGTHRFAVLHDMGREPSRPNPAVEHYEMEHFRDETIETLRITRSAILYLRDAIISRESRQKQDGPRLTLEVVPHHYIRGEG